MLNRKKNSSKNLITYVNDRLGHDFKYAIDPNRIKKELGWESKFDFKKSLKETVLWYLKNKSWSMKIMN